MILAFSSQYFLIMFAVFSSATLINKVRNWTRERPVSVYFDKFSLSVIAS